MTERKTLVTKEHSMSLTFSILLVLGLFSLTGLVAWVTVRIASTTPQPAPQRARHGAQLAALRGPIAF